MIVLFSIFILNYFTTLKSYKDSLSIKTQALNHNLSDSTINEVIDYNEYIKMFWVGLMDGDGSIQVNHWRKQSLQYRLVIKLSNIQSNYNMLVQIAKIIGGTVRVTGKGGDVIWVVNKKQEVEEILKIYDTYPPLTSKKICQLAFLKTCLTQTSVETYLLNRNFKYDQQLNIIKSNIDLKIPSGNTIVIDFNLSYNPYCAYSYKYSCPKVPLENDLAIEIKAGVKKFHD